MPHWIAVHVPPALDAQRQIVVYEVDKIAVCQVPSALTTALCQNSSKTYLLPQSTGGKHEVTHLNLRYFADTHIHADAHHEHQNVALGITAGSYGRIR